MSYLRNIRGIIRGIERTSDFGEDFSKSASILFLLIHPRNLGITR